MQYGPPPPAGYHGQIELMATELGVDLDAALHAMTLSLGAVDRLMRHCAACSDHKTCSAFLVAQHGLIAAPPSYCVDRKLMLYLQSRLPKREVEDDGA